MEVDLISRWTRGVAWATGVLLCATTLRVVQLKVAPSPRLEPAVGSRHSTSREMAARGEILDRRGRVLATSVVGWKLFADPAWIYQQAWDEYAAAHARDAAAPEPDPFADAAAALSPVTDLDEASIQRRLAERADSRYVVLSQSLEDWQVDGIRTIDLEGVGVEPKAVRVYPQGAVGARVIGKVGFEQKGLSGIEMAMESDLAPHDGKLVYLRDVRRRALHIDEEDYRPPEDGRDLRLTIDLVMQEVSERVLEEAVEHYDAGGGRVVVLDPWSGDILAMADVLRRRSGWNEVTDDPLRKIDPALGRNRCVTDPYEPGSTFKPFVWAVATELGKARPESIIPTPSSGPHRTSKGRPIRDVKYYGPVSWRTVLVKSLNSGMAIVAERLSFPEMEQAVRRFGFGTATSCGIGGESAGLLTPTKDWTHFTQTSVAMGHEIGVTPVQMVRAFSAFASDGTMPQLRMRLPADPDAADPQAPRTRVIPEAVALVAREAMASVMTEGTGRKAQSELYRLFGKSGTAQLPMAGGKGYYEDRYVSSFIAGAPLEHPRLVVLCVIDDPDKRRGHFGGSIAGPVVAKVLDECLQYMGVEPDQPKARTQLTSR